MVTPLCERIKNHFIVHFNWVNYSSIKLKKKKKKRKKERKGRLRLGSRGRKCQAEDRKHILGSYSSFWSKSWRVELRPL